MRFFNLALAKYSRAADVARDSAQFSWSHYQQDLSVAVDSHDGRSNLQVLKVLHGHDVLECVPVQEMIAESEEVIQAMLQLRVQVRNEQLPISALVRRPLFALRFNLPGDKVRRLQLKFNTGDDFDKCCNHLVNLGLRISTSADRPSTASPPTGVYSAEGSGPSCPPSRLAEINNRPSTAATVGTSYTNPTVPKISSPLARHSVTMVHQEPELSRASPVSAPRPTSASTQHAQIPPLFPNANPIEPPVYFQRPDSSSSSLELSYSSPTRDRGQPSFLPTIDEESGFPPVPSSSAMLSTHRNTSEALLPPRRELPFARSTPPKSSGSESGRPSSRASSGSGSMGPPPPPNPSHLTQRRSSFGQSTIMELDAPGLLRPTTAEDVGKHISARPRSGSSRPPSRGLDLPLLPPLPQPTIIENTGKANRIQSSPASYDRPSSSDQQNARPLRSLSSAAQNMQSPPSVPSFTTSGSEPSREDRIISEICNEVRANSREALAFYAAQPEHERMAFLNDFMMQHIQDDGFIKLAEDVSVCCSRMGLGLQGE